MTYYRQRIEDLGIIQEKLDNLQNEFSPLFSKVQSKHQIDEFFERYLNAKNLEDLFFQLRSLSEYIDQIDNVAKGYHIPPE